MVTKIVTRGQFLLPSLFAPSPSQHRKEQIIIKDGHDRLWAAQKPGYPGKKGSSPVPNAFGLTRGEKRLPGRSNSNRRYPYSIVSAPAPPAHSFLNIRLPLTHIPYPPS